MVIRFGIIGCGYIGNRHAKHIMEHPEAKLVAAYDEKPEIAAAFCKNYGITQSNSLKELVNNPDIDIISVCTPNGNHFESALAVLEAGKNVIVIHRHLLFFGRIALNKLARIDRVVLERVPHRYQSRAPIGFHHVHGRAGAALAAADQTVPDRFINPRMNEPRHTHRRDRRRRRR